MGTDAPRSACSAVPPGPPACGIIQLWQAPPNWRSSRQRGERSCASHHSRDCRHHHTQVCLVLRRATMRSQLFNRDMCVLDSRNIARDDSARTEGQQSVVCDRMNRVGTTGIALFERPEFLGKRVGIPQRSASERFGRSSRTQRIPLAVAGREVPGFEVRFLLWRSCDHNS